MQDDRKRIVIDDPYISALGLATYCFAICEWNAVWSAEKLKPGYVSTIETKRKTAGTIAQDLLDLIESIQDPALKAVCRPPAAEFKLLVRERNGLLHGNGGS